MVSMRKDIVSDIVKRFVKTRKEDLRHLYGFVNLKFHAVCTEPELNCSSRTSLRTMVSMRKDIVSDTVKRFVKTRKDHSLRHLYGLVNLKFHAVVAVAVVVFLSSLIFLRSGLMTR